mmetsp:Transcript_7415/g.22632  ORF Transcript_7415/g.22632 Transcript_7415/m.22632 type:complete len:230 (+) Transcript_7415:224-913(+)
MTLARACKAARRHSHASLWVRCMAANAASWSHLSAKRWNLLAAWLHVTGSSQSSSAATASKASSLPLAATASNARRAARRTSRSKSTVISARTSTVAASSEPRASASIASITRTRRAGRCSGRSSGRGNMSASNSSARGSAAPARMPIALTASSRTASSASASAAAAARTATSLPWPTAGSTRSAARRFAELGSFSTRPASSSQATASGEPPQNCCRAMTASCRTSSRS